jgi:transposase
VDIIRQASWICVGAAGVIAPSLFPLLIVAERALVKCERIGVDCSTKEPNSVMRGIVRCDNAETYHETLKRTAAESGIETPTNEDLARLERTRLGKKLANELDRSGHQNL